MTHKKFVLAALAVATLAGCGGSGGGGANSENGSSDGKGSNKPATEAQAIAAIKGTWSLNGSNIEVDTQQTYPSTNLDDISRNDLFYCYGGSRCALDPNKPAVQNKTARYIADENELIPVYYNVNPSSDKIEEKDPRFAQAIAAINEVVGRPIFKDMGYIYVDHDLNNAGFNLDYSSVQAQGGMIFSVGTSVKIDESQQSCGSVSEAPNTMSLPRVIIDENNHYKSDAGWLWLNLDSADGTCLADVEIATHELMHALGFTDHFAGFGADGEVFGDRAKAALRTLYNNDAQSDPDNLTYYHWPAN